MASEKERRRFPRRFFKRKVGVLSQGVYQNAIGVEIGEGGMMFSIDKEISEQAKVLVNFRVPNHGFVVVVANVRNTRHTEGLFQYGVQFDDLDFQNRRRIRDYIAEKTEDEALEERQMQNT
jgi:c-di-GMP-binding flagellar brake protein YcgR